MAQSGTVTQSSAVVEELIWQDRDLRFDCPPALLTNRRGEFTIESAIDVEDTKGAHSDKGSLAVTNLRIIFVNEKDAKSNISIGLACVTGVAVKSSESRLKGRVHACQLSIKQNNSRFEFIFAIYNKSVPSLYSNIQATHRAYESTRLYRDLKLRGAIIREHTLILLPDETIYSRIEGVWNLSSDQGNLGTLFVTNCRLVWHANLAENFNVSIPLMQIKVAKLRDSKFGHALVVETSARSGGYILGFRIDPMEKLTEVFQEIKTLHEVYSVNPVFGVKVPGVNGVQSDASADADRTKAPITDDVEIVNDEHGDALAAYYATDDSSGSKELDYSAELGLAVERLKDGKMTIATLWSVVT